jgi:hypothetical protein
MSIYSRNIIVSGVFKTPKATPVPSPFLEWSLEIYSGPRPHWHHEVICKSIARITRRPHLISSIDMGHWKPTGKLLVRILNFPLEWHDGVGITTSPIASPVLETGTPGYFILYFRNEMFFVGTAGAGSLNDMVLSSNRLYDGSLFCADAIGIRTVLRLDE